MKERADVNGVVTGPGWLDARSRAATWTRSETLQSSIRSRWADQSAVRGSGAHSRCRPSVWVGGHDFVASSPEAHQKGGRAGRDQAGAVGQVAAVMNTVALAARPAGARASGRPGRVGGGRDFQRARPPAMVISSWVGH